MGFAPFRAILNNLEKISAIRAPLPPDRPAARPGWQAGSPAESCRLIAPVLAAINKALPIPRARHFLTLFIIAFSAKPTGYK
jgi:hypothetical protein